MAKKSMVESSLFRSLDSQASLHTNNILFSCLVQSSLVKQETSCTVILPPTVSVLCASVQSHVYQLIRVTPARTGKSFDVEKERI